MLFVQMDSMYIDTVPDVQEYVFAKKTRDLYYIRSNKKADSLNGVYHLRDSVQFLVDSTAKAYSKLAVNKDGRRAVWLATKDSAKAKVKRYELHLSMDQMMVHAVDTSTQNMPEGFMVSEVFQPSFSDDGKHLYFKTRHIPVHKEEDTMKLKSEQVHLDVWSWSDTLPQPAQLHNLEKDKKESFLAVWHLDQAKMVQLESKSLKTVNYSIHHSQPLLVGIDQRSYLKEMSWNYPVGRDVYLVDISSGERRLIEKGVNGYPKMSPAGSYVYWYEKVSQNWVAYDLNANEKILLNQFKEPVYDIENDLPSPANAYGSPGWSKNDHFIYIYDEYDVWRVDPRRANHPYRVTNGRENNNKFRFIDLDRSAWSAVIPCCCRFGSTM